ncbi:hypothetical protein KR059_002431 [Drosophila kikkawai]|nr:hypothetical protein KR059_002431 [Drosophila kikkawai]
MWEKLVNCIKGGAGFSQKQGCQAVQMADLMKQVPPNQLKQFKIFAKKHEEYKERVRKYPESLPAIDWEYYRQNVRPEFVSWVKTYESKYDKLHSLFENRHTLVDHKRYFQLVDKESKEVQKEIRDFKDASNKRIEKLTEQLEFLKSLKPYEEMTMEEFCYASPHLAPDFINKPTFWPHTPEEQMPGPSDPEAAAALHEEEHESPEPPKKASPPEAESAPEKPATMAAPEKPPGDTKENVEAKGSEIAEKATKLAKDLLEKATVLLYTLKEKMTAMAKDVQKKAEAAKAARKEAAGKSSDTDSTSSDPSDQKMLDSFSERDSKPNICNQTIIRSEEEARNPEVKARHADLTIEAEPCESEEDRIRQKTRDLERRRQKEEQRERDGISQEVPDPCKPKEEEPVCEAQSDLCESKEEPICETLPDPCKPKEEEPVCKAQPDPCESNEQDICQDQPDPCKKEEPECKTEPDPCKPKEDEPKHTEQVYTSPSKCSEDVHKKDQEKQPKKPGDKPKESASLTDKIEGMYQKLIMGQVAKFKDPMGDEKATISGAVEVGPVYKDPNQIVQLLAEKKEAKEAEAKEASRIEEAVKPADAKPITIYPKREISAKPKTQVPEKTKKSSEELAKDVHSMAQGAASLLSDASNILSDLKKNKEVRIEVLEQAYISAQKQALSGLAEASKAVNAANKLSKRSREAPGEVSSQDLAMADKHAAVAKNLANHAVALKDEIARVLKDLKKKA